MKSSKSLIIRITIALLDNLLSLVLLLALISYTRTKSFERLALQLFILGFGLKFGCSIIDPILPIKSRGRKQSGLNLELFQFFSLDFFFQLFGSFMLFTVLIFFLLFCYPYLLNVLEGCSMP